jgi:hypothetical protein
MVAGGLNSGNSVAYSYDGINWQNGDLSNCLTGGCYSVGWNGSLWVAGGAGTGILAYSSDGIHWYGSTSNVLSTGCNTVAWNGYLWVAGGSGISNQVAYSSDGINWSPSSSTVFSGNCKSVAWNGALWVAGGQGTNTLGYSYDGSGWTPSTSSVFTTNCNAVAWNGLLWVAGGQGTNTLAYSSDGINWTPSLSNVFSSGCNAVAWNGSLWVAGGQGTNTLAYSYDGSGWTSSPSSVLTTACLSVAWNGTYWVAGGQGTNNLAYSTDGINWTPSNSNVLLTACSALASRRPLPYVGETVVPPIFHQYTGPGGGGPLIYTSPTGTNNLYYSRVAKMVESGDSGFLSVRGNILIPDQSGNQAINMEASIGGQINTSRVKFNTQGPSSTSSYVTIDGGITNNFFQIQDNGSNNIISYDASTPSTQITIGRGQTTTISGELLANQINSGNTITNTVAYYYSSSVTFGPTAGLDVSLNLPGDIDISTNNTRQYTFTIVMTGGGGGGGGSKYVGGGGGASSGIFVGGPYIYDTSNNTLLLSNNTCYQVGAGGNGGTGSLDDGGGNGYNGVPTTIQWKGTPFFEVGQGNAGGGASGSNGGGGVAQPNVLYTIPTDWSGTFVDIIGNNGADGDGDYGGTPGAGPTLQTYVGSAGGNGGSYFSASAHDGDKAIDGYLTIIYTIIDTYNTPVDVYMNYNFGNPTTAPLLNTYIENLYTNNVTTSGSTILNTVSLNNAINTTYSARVVLQAATYGSGMMGSVNVSSFPDGLWMFATTPDRTTDQATYNAMVCGILYIQNGLVQGGGYIGNVNGSVTTGVATPGNILNIYNFSGNNIYCYASMYQLYGAISGIPILPS